MPTDGSAPLPTAETNAHPRSVARRYGVVVGIVVAAVALGAGQLTAAVVAPDSAPLTAVGQAAIDRTPEWLKSFAIRTFGERDKLVLIGGMIGALVAVAAGAGIAATRKRSAGNAFLLIIGAFGMAAAVTRPTATWWWALPSAVAVIAGGVSLRLLLAHLGDRVAPTAEGPPPAAGKLRAFDRRSFVRGALTLGGVALGTGVVGAVASERRFGARASRAEVRIPAPADPAPSLPPGAQLDIPDLTPFVTPNADFYRVDTALFPPQLRADSWRLKIHGMVDQPMELSFDRLLARDLVERDITLSCVSNEVGGPYAGNARWTGALLRPLLDEAGIQADATQLVSRSTDGMTIGTPTAVVMDGRDAMLAIAMNGEPLPIEHGFPVRMLVPGLFGYVSATKWLVEIEATTFEAFAPYWVERGWVQDPGAVKTMSRIDTPRPLARVPEGTVPIAGVAWAQHRGIGRVEVRVDEGSWQIAELAEVPNIDTWRQWVWRWDAVPGTHTLQVRATDADGVTQPEERTPPFPEGATGWHSVVVTVE